MKSRHCCLPALLAITATGAAAQSAPSGTMFPFVLPWDGGAPKSVTDVSWMNPGAAGANGYIVCENGHFAEARTHRRIRFIGTNFAAKSAFPSHADAEKVAIRLARLGINIVRMHHMDNVDWGQESSIWDYSFKDRQHISATQLDKLDYLIAQLKKNGIYTNLNLHVSRQFSAADGFPPDVSQIKFGFDKRVDEFDTRMRTLQKNYARDLLTHVNPYTGLAYTTDPAIAVVEINNENSLVGDPWAEYGGDLTDLPEPFKAELAQQWNAWLKTTYRNGTILREEWTKGITPPGPPLLTASNAWSSEHQGEAQAEFTPGAAGSNGLKSIRAVVSKADGTDWHVQAHQTGLNLKEGETYTVSFRAKADQSRTIAINAGLDQADWHNIGLNASAGLTTEWKRFKFTFRAERTVAHHARVAFVLGGMTGGVDLADLQVQAGADPSALPTDSEVTNGMVAVPEGGLPAAKQAWIHFLADTELSYAVEMRAFIKDELKSKANVICSQVSWGGLTGLRRENSMDFADNHAYWEHPVFPHKPWDAEDWYIRNTSMVRDLAAGKGGALIDLARYRIEGKPYTISEYNHPAPGDYRAECTPLLATFAALQDWDAIYLFDYGDYGTGVQNDRINGYFGISSDPAKTAFLPAAAQIFRQAHIDPGTKSVLPVRLSKTLEASASLWPEMSPGALFTRSLSVKLDPVVPADLRIPPPGREVTRAAASIQRNSDLGTAAFTADSGSVLVAVGQVGRQEYASHSAVLRFSGTVGEFAAATITSADGEPLATAKHILVTLVSKVENQDMSWNTARTSVGSKWGHGPTVASGVGAEIRIKSSSAATVWALDGAGRRTLKVPATLAAGWLEFAADAKYRTLWYEVERK